MKKFLLSLIIVFLCVSCRSLSNAALTKIGILEDKAYIEYISSKKKKMAFIHMHHIGTDTFYNDVAKNVDSLQKEGYLTFYEGVANSKQTDSIEDDLVSRKTRKILGLLPVKYFDTISKKIGGIIKYKGDKKLINQPSYHLLKVDTLNAVKADIELKELIKNFESKNG